MYDIFETVDGDDLALAALVVTASDNYFVVFANRDGADLERVNVLVVTR